MLVLRDEKGQSKIVVDYLFGKSTTTKSPELNKDIQVASTTGTSTSNAAGKTENASHDGPTQLAPMKGD